MLRDRVAHSLIPLVTANKIVVLSKITSLTITRKPEYLYICQIFPRFRGQNAALGQWLCRIKHS